MSSHVVRSRASENGIVEPNVEETGVAVEIEIETEIAAPSVVGIDAEIESVSVIVHSFDAP